MKHFKKLILRVLIASLIFSGCSNLEDSSEISAQKYGSLVVKLQQAEDSRLMPVSEISSAVVTVSGNDMLRSNRMFRFQTEKVILQSNRFQTEKTESFQFRR